jgi:DNA processing protein
VTSGAEMLEVLGGSGSHLLEVPRGPTRARDRLTLRQQQVLDAVPVSDVVSADSIARTAGIGLMETRSALSRLLRAGLVDQAGHRWRLGPAGRGDAPVGRR